jgi:cytochrome P450
MSGAGRLPPGPPLPVAIQTLLWIRRPIPYMRWCRARYGSTFAIELPGTRKVVLLSEPGQIKQVFTGDPELLRAGEVNVILGPLVGEHSVLLLDGARHLRHRRMMLPPFHGERMRLYARTMQRVTERDIAAWPRTSPFSLRPRMQRVTLDIILATVFGAREGELVELRRRLEELLSIADSPAAMLALLPSTRLDWPLLPWRRFLRLRARADEAIYEILRRRRAANRPGDDVLSLLLAAVDEDGHNLDDAELRDELMTLLVAGHETTATAICWAFERILDNPPVLERLLAELREVTAGQRLTPEHLPRLEFLEATIHEALRCRPVIPLVGRRLHAPLSLGDYELPAGWIVAPSVYLTHHHPGVYADADAFRPERFLGKRPDPYAWLPFGGGIRRCLGMAFALYEMKVVMATILGSRRLELAQRAPVPTVRRAITFSPERGTVVRASALGAG